MPFEQPERGDQERAVASLHFAFDRRETVRLVLRVRPAGLRALDKILRLRLSSTHDLSGLALGFLEDLVRCAPGQQQNLAECCVLHTVLIELLLEDSDPPVESRASRERGLVPYGHGRDEPIDVAGLVAAEASTERRVP